MASRQAQLTRVAAGEGARIRIGGFGTVVKVTREATGGSVGIVEHTLGPGLLGAAPHLHTREDETSYVLEGRLTVQVGGEVVTAGPGDMGAIAALAARYGMELDLAGMPGLMERHGLRMG